MRYVLAQASNNYLINPNSSYSERKTLEVVLDYDLVNNFFFHSENVNLGPIIKVVVYGFILKILKWSYWLVDFNY